MCQTYQMESCSSEMARWSSNEWKDIIIGHESAVNELTLLFHGCLAAGNTRGNESA